MSNQKRLAITAAVVACFALAFPVLASGAVWKHEGVNLAKFVELGLPGGEVFETEISGVGSGMTCEVKATMTTTGGSTATITKYEIKNCKGSFGNMTGCQVNVAEAKGLPWTVHVNATDLTITNLRIRRTFKAGCVLVELDKTFAAVTVKLNNLSAIAGMEFSGSLGGYKAFGSWEVEGANAGTYGIG
jgi:hypothetical protein